MRIPSGTTDQYIYFVAVDATDLLTRETALTGFTVRSSRNGGASFAYTTPTVNETDVTNMPGVYELLLDEDMTIASGNDSEEVCLHITHASMAPVTRVFELYRPKATVGETLTVTSSGLGWADVRFMVGDVLTADAIATGAFTADALAADAGSELADALLDKSAGVETGLTVRQALRLMASVLFAKASGMATTTAVFRDYGDTKDRVTATVDSSGNRSAVTTDST